MPPGVYERKPGVNYGGRKPECSCGTCSTCLRRVRDRRYYKAHTRACLDRRAAALIKRKGRIVHKPLVYKEEVLEVYEDDLQLEEKMIQYFAARGWD